MSTAGSVIGSPSATLPEIISWAVPKMFSDGNLSTAEAYYDDVSIYHLLKDETPIEETVDILWSDLNIIHGLVGETSETASERLIRHSERWQRWPFNRSKRRE